MLKMMVWNRQLLSLMARLLPATKGLVLKVCHSRTTIALLPFKKIRKHDSFFQPTNHHLSSIFSRLVLRHDFDSPYFYPMSFRANSFHYLSQWSRSQASSEAIPKLKTRKTNLKMMGVFSQIDFAIGGPYFKSGGLCFHVGSMLV